jgi:glycosyltransferase involved in cell wall biosynthesis
MTESSAPSVIICVPTFRRPAGLRKLLTHIARLNYPGKVSIVVVDNDDEARAGAAIVEQMAPNFRFPLRSCVEPRRGHTYAYNSAFALACRSTLDRMPQHVACFAHHLRIAEDGSPLSTGADLRWKLFPASDTLRHLVAKNFIVCGAICIRTDAARAVEGFNPTLKLGEDWEFWCRLAVLGDFAAMPDHVALQYRQRFASANYRLRKAPLRQNFEAIDAVFSNPAIRQKFTPAELKRRRRLAEIDAFWAGARNEYVRNHAFGFLGHLIVGAFCYPDSVLRPRLVYLFVRGLLQHLRRPQPAREGR